MSQITDNLELHLPLDEIENGKVFDETDHHRDATIPAGPAGATAVPQLVPDHDFGVCMRFDGVDDFLTLPPEAIPAGGQITVAFWAKGGAGLPKKTALIWAEVDGGTRTLNVRLPWEDKQVYFDCGNNGNTPDRLQKAVLEADFQGEWRHWAFTKNAVTKEMAIYLNGHKWANGTDKAALLPTPKKVFLGGFADSFYQGLVSNLRIYSRALAADDLQEVMDADRIASAVFRRTHPLGFDLLDDDDQQVLAISDNPAIHTLRLEIHNTSQQTIGFAHNSDAPSKDNCNFALMFRPGTIQSFKDITLAPADWQLGFDTPSNSLYFLKTAPPFTLEPDARLTLPLQKLTADGRGGARGTRVELRYNKLNYAASTEDLKGTAVQHVSIVNERGKKHVPLHVGIVGSNTILNDGRTQNERRLRITNVTDEPIALVPLVLVGDAPTKFILSFDVFDELDQSQWALGDRSAVAAIAVEARTSSDWPLLTPEDISAAEVVNLIDQLFSAPVTLTRDQRVVSSRVPRVVLSAGIVFGTLMEAEARDKLRADREKSRTDPKIIPALGQDLATALNAILQKKEATIDLDPCDVVA